MSKSFSLYINIDIVYIPTVNSQHYENCKKALKHHKHVIVEKTFALTVLEAKELFTLRIINI
ncbi:Gfo/Idh/MocA family oxidoreductase [Thomasclavelia ramosa]|uniref:Gfo/Idh/MocA family oxidoreductase n=1 Tax=Thomasclavelia ramosa TaxID=1547 RepID=UPI003002A3A7